MATRKRTSAKAKATVPTKAKAKEQEQEKNGSTRVAARDFVPVYQSSATVDEVAEHFGQTLIWVSSFASRLRKLGVNLKKMPRSGGRRRLNVDELNSLAEEALSE